MQKNTSDRVQKARAFVESLKGDMSKADTESAVNMIAAQRYSVKITASALAGFVKVECWMDVNGTQYAFEGRAFGTTLVGGATYWGHVYTNDVEKLVGKTNNFNVNAVTVFPAGYVNVNFFDADSKILGHAHGGGVSSPAFTFTGGGVGAWRR